MEELELNFDTNEFNAILEKDSSIEDFLMSIFSAQDKASYRKICDQLLRYYSGDQENPHIESFSLYDVKYDPAAKTGSVCFQFNVKFWFGCSGLERVQSGQETVKFTIDEGHTSVILVFPQLEERSTHEEF
jgi:hypothetical protein